MGVTRYRDISEMPAPPRARPEELAHRIRQAWARAAAMVGLEPPRGVQRFRTLEEAQNARSAETLARVTRLRDARKRKAQASGTG